MGLLEEAAAAITGAERRIDVASRNISNSQTPGYKREISYTEISESLDSRLHKTNLPVVTKTMIHTDPGVLVESNNALDISIRGDGYFLLRDRDTFFLSRVSQFRRDKDGNIVDGQGRVLQQAGGGDLMLDTDTPVILADGTVLSDAAPVGTIGVYVADGGASSELLRTGIDRDTAMALTESDAAEIAQGMTERSNVILSDEMIGLARTQRLAEAGAQLVRAYDQLIGQAVSTFGRRGG